MADPWEKKTFWLVTWSVCGVCCLLTLAALFCGIKSLAFGLFYFVYNMIFLMDQYRPVRYRTYFFLGYLFWAFYAMAHLTFYLFTGTESIVSRLADSLLPPLIVIPALFPLFYFFTSFNDKRYTK